MSIVTDGELRAMSTQMHDDRVVVVLVCHNIGLPPCILQTRKRRNQQQFLIAFLRDGSQEYITPEISAMFDWFVFYNGNVPYSPCTPCSFKDLNSFICDLLTIVNSENILLLTFEKTLSYCVTRAIDKYCLRRL
ncbi:hypothetical protein L596_021030 [Steinernema carpocapsae]|uniref:Uncharacterized protein n=2 Tax=Steinernema carpocapsae TaxID=34508 RepID=A0A4U5MVH6_STECR|nr:hypothetical protein L596_021030 [Steinernema carpocapsae]